MSPWDLARLHRTKRSARHERDGVDLVKAGADSTFKRCTPGCPDHPGPGAKFPPGI